MGGRGGREFQITQWVFRTIRILLHNSFKTIFSELLLAINARLLQINTPIRIISLVLYYPSVLTRITMFLKYCKKKPDFWHVSMILKWVNMCSSIFLKLNKVALLVKVSSHNTMFHTMVGW